MLALRTLTRVTRYQNIRSKEACLSSASRNLRYFNHKRMLQSRTLPEDRDITARIEKPEVRPRASLLEKLSFKDKVTVITGGARGIGLEIAKALADQGSSIALLDLLDPQEDVGALETMYGTMIKFYRTDVTNKDSLEASFKQTVADFGRIDKCVTAAGVVVDKPFLQHSWKDATKILNVNILGTFFAAQLAAQQMIKQGTGGSIVMIASVASYCALPGQRVSIYGASKAAVKLLAKTLGVEMAPANVRINSISPGFIATAMSSGIAISNPDLHRIFSVTPPMERIGDPEDLTAGVVYLLSDAASYTTGTDIPITGALHGGRINT